jgi:hypothetical protein
MMLDAEELAEARLDEATMKVNMM